MRSALTSLTVVCLIAALGALSALLSGERAGASDRQAAPTVRGEVTHTVWCVKAPCPQPPAAGVLVVAHADGRPTQRTRTDEQGRFALALSPGRWQLSARSGRSHARQTVRVRRGQTSHARLRLTVSGPRQRVSLSQLQPVR